MGWLEIAALVFCAVYIGVFIYACFHQDDPFWFGFVNWMGTERWRDPNEDK